jgi:hypothetical protein
MCRDYYDLDFMDRSVDTAPIAPALRAFFDDVLEASVAELNFKAIVDGLGAVLFEYPFRCVCVWWWLGLCGWCGPRFAAHGLYKYNLSLLNTPTPNKQSTPLPAHPPHKTNQTTQRARLLRAHPAFFNCTRGPRAQRGSAVQALGARLPVHGAPVTHRPGAAAARRV